MSAIAPHRAPAAAPRTLGVTVMPEWFPARASSRCSIACATGRDRHRDQPLRARARAGRRGRARAAARWRSRAGAPARPAAVRPHELWVRTAPSFVHDPERYAGLRYQPSAADRRSRCATRPILDRVIDGCRCARHRGAAAGDGGESARVSRAVSARRTTTTSASERTAAARRARGPQRVAREPARRRLRRHTRRGTRGALSRRGGLPARLAGVPALRLRQRAVRLQSGRHRRRCARWGAIRRRSRATSAIGRPACGAR